MSKYKAKKTIVDGIIFDSQKEAQRWCELRLLEKAGVIKNLQRQVPFVIIPTQYEEVVRFSQKTGKQLKSKTKVAEKVCLYYADFTYLENENLVVEDVKGCKKGEAYDLFVIKRKLMLERYGIKIKET